MYNKRYAYSVTVTGEYFAANRLAIKTWLIDRNIFYLWLDIGRETAPGRVHDHYIVFFDHDQDAVAFQLRFLDYEVHNNNSQQ